MIILINMEDKVSNPANDPYVLIKPETEWTVEVRGTVSNGGGTGQEYPKCLYEDNETPGSKWLDTHSGETWVKATFQEPQPVYLILIKSANDCPTRDPYKIVIYGDDKEIGTWDNLEFEKRFETKSFFLDDIRPVKSLKLSIVKNKNFHSNGSWGDGTQIAQIKFLKLSC
jgi:hypothetical protein